MSPTGRILLAEPSKNVCYNAGMKKVSFFILICIALCGCEKVHELAEKSRGNDKPAAKTDVPQAVKDSAAENASNGEDKSNYNSMFASEDDASKSRRQKAKASLGLK